MPEDTIPFYDSNLSIKIKKFRKTLCNKLTHNLKIKFFKINLKMNFISANAPNTLQNNFPNYNNHQNTNINSGQESDEENAFKRNINFILFHSSIQNFLRIENSTEDISFDFNNYFFTQNTSPNLIDNKNIQNNFSVDLLFLKGQFESKFI